MPGRRLSESVAIRRAAHRDFAHQHDLPFPLISDVDGSLRKAFGVPRTLGLFPGRVTYVIDKAGIVRLIFSAQFASEEHVRQALSAVGGERVRSLRGYHAAIKQPARVRPLSAVLKPFSGNLLADGIRSPD